MARAISAQQGGFELQALLFFIQGCRLVHPHEGVRQVGFEVNGAEGFDDIQVSYSDPIPDGRGERCDTDYEQVKYRVTHHGQVIADDLTRPEFIGATSESLLQKVHRLQQRHAPDGTGCRLILRQPYPIGSDDLLALLIEKREGYLRLETLFDGKERSRMAELRRRWREHLGVDDDGLRLALMPLRLRHDPRTLDDVRAQLNKDLMAAGLEPVPAGQLTSPYEVLPWKLAAATGEVYLDHPGLVTLMREQGLYRGPPLNMAPTRRLGLRSYAWNADYIERDTEAHLCCLNHFEDRVIRDADLWKTHVHPEVMAFLERELKPGEHVHLSLEAHYSVVFAAGRATARSSARVWPVQFGEVWNVGARPVPPFEKLWDFHEEPIGTGQDIVVAVSVAQDVREDVRRALDQFSLPAMVLLEATVLPGVGRQAVLGADHAYLLAQALMQRVQGLSARVGRGQRIHLFVSLPKALMFFLGQEARTLRNIQLYEFDGAYLPALLID